MLIKTCLCLPRASFSHHNSNLIAPGLLVAPHYPQVKVKMRLVVISTKT